MEPEKHIVVKRETFYEMVYHCMQEKPLRACGMLAGGAEKADVLEKMASVESDSEDATSETIAHLEMKSRLQGRGLKALAYYRCRPDGKAEPSQYEVEFFSDPAICLIVVSLQGSGVPMVKAFSVIGGQIAGVRIDIE